MELILNILAVALVGAAAYFYFGGGDWDRIFACLVLASCSFFLSMRFRIKKRLAEYHAQQAETGEEPPAD